MNTALAAALHEEYFESWDHFSSDKLVYFRDVVEGNFKEWPWNVNWSSEYKLKRAFIDLHLILSLKGRDMQFRAIVEGALLMADARGMGDVETELTGIDSQRRMLVDITERVQSPERVFAEPIPSIIRLKRLDNLDGFTGDIPSGSSKSFFAPSGLVAMDRKVGVSGRGSSTQKRQVPRELAETGSKVVGKIAHQEGDYRRDIGFEAKDVHSLFNIVLFPNGHRITFNERADFILKAVEVYFCPPELKRGHINGIVHHLVTRKASDSAVSIPSMRT